MRRRLMGLAGCDMSPLPAAEGKEGEVMTEANVIGSLRHLAFEAATEAMLGREKWGRMNSAHEGYAVMLEEVDELKAHVWTKQKLRDLEAMRKEAIQVAAMALRIADECCDEINGRK